MYKVIPAILLGATLASCTGNNVASNGPGHDSVAVHNEVSITATVIEQLDGYFVNNTVQLPEGYTTQHPTNQQEFDKLFGMAQTMNNKISTPDFEKNIIIAVIHSATDKMETITFLSSAVENGTLTIRLATPETAKKSFSITPLALFSIAKDPTIKQIVFENEQKQQLGSVALP